MLILWNVYRQGNGVLQDLEESGKWLYLAAASGEEDAKKGIKELEEKHPSQEGLNGARIKAKE